MKLKNTITTLIIFIFLVDFTACMSKKTVVGKWKGSGTDETVEFFKDGTIASQSQGRILNGKYNIIDENHLKMELGGMGTLAGPIIVQYKFSGNELILTLQNNQTTNLQRIE